MIYRNKGRFILEIECLQEIVNNMLKLPENNDIKIEIIKSINKNSKSRYLKFHIGEDTNLLRISDHYCKGEVRQIIVKESTGIANVCYKIDCAIKNLRYKRLNRLLEGGVK